MHFEANLKFKVLIIDITIRNVQQFDQIIPQFDDFRKFRMIQDPKIQGFLRSA